jgi:hypothetical protein
MRDKKMPEKQCPRCGCYLYPEPYDGKVCRHCEPGYEGEWPPPHCESYEEEKIKRLWGRYKEIGFSLEILYDGRITPVTAQQIYELEEESKEIENMLGEDESKG